jgi:uncharacterized protein (TIGR02246 family)
MEYTCYGGFTTTFDGQDSDESTGGPRSAEDEVRELLAVYERALNTDDTALAVSCYTRDGVFMPTTLPTAAGPGLTQAYDQTFAAIHLDVIFTIDELVVASDTVAYALTRSNGTQTVHATGSETAESNREVFLFAFEDGAWKISRYLFNKPQ